MSDIEVYTEALRAAAGATRDASGDIAGLGLGAALAGLASGLPGTRTEGESAAMAEHWDTRTSKCADALADRADKLVAAADEYDAQDRSAAEDFERLGPRTPEGPI